MVGVRAVEPGGAREYGQGRGDRELRPAVDGRACGVDPDRAEVSAEGGSTVTDAARLTVVSAPRIVTQPLSVCVREGKTVTIKVKAVGGGLKYQWYCQKPEDGRWQEITNSVQASFTVTAKMARNGYKYKCLVSNKAGSVWSKPVKLTVT